MGAGAHGHELDETDLPGMVVSQTQEVPDLIVVDATQQDAVDLEPVKARLLRRGDARQGVRQPSPAGEEGELLLLQGIETDVQPGDPGGAQGRGEVPEPGTVGGQTELLQPRQGGKALAEGQKPPADQGFPPGEADLPDAQRNGGLADLRQLLDAKHLFVGALGDAVFLHAVAAAEITALRDGEAQVVDGPAEAVPHVPRLP